MKYLSEAAGLQENPAALYLSTLGTMASRRGMVSPLNRAAQFLNPGLEGSRAWERAGWDALSAPVIRSIMATMEGSPATRKKCLAALKGVARSAWELGLLETEDYQRIRGIKGPRGGGEFAGRHIHIQWRTNWCTHCFLIARIRSVNDSAPIRCHGIEFAGAAARCRIHHYANLICGPGNGRIHRHLLLRSLDDSHFRQPLLEPHHRPGGGKVNRC